MPCSRTVLMRTGGARNRTTTSQSEEELWLCSLPSYLFHFIIKHNTVITYKDWNIFTVFFLIQSILISLDRYTQYTSIFYYVPLDSILIYYLYNSWQFIPFTSAVNTGYWTTTDISRHLLKAAGPEEACPPLWYSHFLDQPEHTVWNVRNGFPSVPDVNS